MMRAWLLDDFTGLQALHLAEVPEPEPGPDEAVLQLQYAALNPADRYLAEKLYPLRPPLPHILGRDGLGTVLRVGKEVQGVKVGDVRMIMRGDTGGTRAGTFAEQVAVPAADLAAIPNGWNPQEASGAVLVYLTAHQALTMWGELAPGSVVLVTGASGGVGVASVQLGTAMGYKVIALSRSAQKREQLLRMGCSLSLDPGDPGWRAEVKKSKLRVDLAIDNVGGTLLPEVIDTLAENGRVSLVGRLAGPVPNFNTATLFFRRLRLGGVAVGAVSRQESQAAWLQLVALLERTGTKPLVDSIFAFDQLLQAFDRLAKGPMGKVLLAVNPPVG
jgi:NADPH2:quinone reductase